jgi:pimeloyl-ACP methyl ester carboxylesterase
MRKIKSAGILLSLAYITIETYRYIRFIRTRDWLRVSQTPPSNDFSHDEWFHFFISRIKRNPHIFQKFMEYIFWNRPYETIDVASINACLLTLSSGCEISQMHKFICDKARINTYKEIVKEIVKKHTFNNPKRSDELLYFIRINDPEINHSPAIPLFRPMPVSLAFRCLRYYGDMRFYNNGYTYKKTDNGFVLWIKETNRDGKTLCFFHGLGFGAIPYFTIIERIAKQNSYDNIIFVEIPGISGNSYPKSKITSQEIANVILENIEMYKIIDVISHSYGTCVLTYIENRYPDFFRKSVYIDPICFFPCNTKFWPITFKQMKWLTDKRRLISVNELFFSEQYHSHLIHNSSYFYEFTNREKKMTKNTMILLGGKDILIDSREIYEYIQTNYPDVILHYFENDKHGSCLLQRNKHYFVAIGNFLMTN